MAELLFGVHNHQPVDNFRSVVDRAVESAYKPFLEAVSRCERFKLAVHFSGWLFEEIKNRHPETFGLLKRLVERGQIELFTGGFYEPILPSVPSFWRRYQIEKLTSFIREHFGVTPKGAWIAERVWEDALVKDLVECGVEYVVLDDYHFECSGVRREELNGYFLTEYEGECIKVFPIDSRLRYLVPFHPVKEVESYLSSEGLKVLFDDGEKFGIWPHTYQWVYEKGWLKELVEAVESGRITLKHFSEAVSGSSKGIVYLSPVSYHEMGEWALLPEDHRRLKELSALLKNNGMEWHMRRFVRGNQWKTFFLRYFESNYMHKRMLNLSKLPIKDEEFLESIARAQCNDVFWHGIFGGIYLPNLRDNFWRYTIQATTLAEKSGKFPSGKVQDVDCDGYPEALLSTEEVFAVLSPRMGGALIELSLKREKFNYQNTLTRRKESYHESEGAGKTGENPGEIPTIHEITPHIQEKPPFDWHIKGSFISHFTDYIDQKLFERENFRELSDFTAEPYSFECEGNDVLMWREGGIYTGGTFKATLKKRFTAKGSSIKVEETFETSYREELLHLLEVNLHFMDIGNVKVEVLKPFKVAIFDGSLGKVLYFTFSREVSVLHYLIETFHQREGGMEKTVQGLCLGFFFPFQGQFSFTTLLEVKDV